MEKQVNLIATVLMPDNIVLDLAAKNRGAVFDAVGRIWQENNGLNQAEVVAALEARESIGSTGVGQGLAIPHARLKGVEQAIAAFVRLKTPIDFDAPDETPVGDFFVLLVPSHATELHLQILAEVAEKMSNAGFRERLRAAASASEIVRLFSE